MSPEPWQDRIIEMLNDIDRIAAFIGPMDREAFVADDKSVFAVCYAFVRLGEAVVHIPQELTSAHPEVEWRDIRHFRNFMIHVYLAVDPARLFDTATTKLPALRAKLLSILHSGGLDPYCRPTT